MFLRRQIEKWWGENAMTWNTTKENMRIYTANYKIIGESMICVASNSTCVNTEKSW